MTVTDQQFANELMIPVEDHDPYVFGGINLHTGADCSGEFVGAQIALGLSHDYRTSQEMFAHWPVAPGPTLGVAVFFYVQADGTAPGDQPGHMGLCLGNGMMEEEPHTGLDAEVVKIPNIPRIESIMGYRYVPGVTYGATTGPTKPTTTAPPQQEDDMAFQYGDPETGKVIATDANGNLYVEPGVPDLTVTTLSEHPEWKAGEAESAGQNPCVGAVPWKDPSGRWGYAYITKPASGTGSLGPYSTYHIGRDGTPH